MIVDLVDSGLLGGFLALTCEFIAADITVYQEFEMSKRQSARCVLYDEISIERFSAEEVRSAITLQRTHRGLGSSEAFAVVLGRRSEAVLLSDCASIRRVAKTEGLDCCGRLWIIVQLQQRAHASEETLSNALRQWRMHSEESQGTPITSSA